MNLSGMTIDQLDVLEAEIECAARDRIDKIVSVMYALQKQVDQLHQLAVRIDNDMSDEVRRIHERIEAIMAEQEKQ